MNQDNLSLAFAAFRASYLAIYPLPQEPEKRAFDTRSIMAAMVFILCLTIYAATRTASVVAITEEASGYSTILAHLLSWVAVVGIEGMLLYMSITHTREEERLYPQDHAKILIVLGGIISALAGISSGLGLIEVAQWAGVLVFGRTVNIGLTLFLGVGATLMVWASGEFVGTALHNYRVQQGLAQRLWQEARENYEARLRATWDKSPEKAAALHDLELLRARQSAEMEAEHLRRQAELDILRKQADHDQKHANYRRDKGVDMLGLGNAPAQPDAPQENGPNQMQLAQSWLDEHPDRPTWRTADEVPSAREIGAHLQQKHGKNFSTGSLQKARTQFINTHFPTH